MTTKPDFTVREMCAIVITKAIRADVQPMVLFTQELRRQGYDDLEVGRLFTETAMIIFGETWPEDEKFCQHEYCAGQEHCIYSPDAPQGNEETNETTSQGERETTDPDPNREQDLLR